MTNPRYESGSAPEIDPPPTAHLRFESNTATKHDLTPVAELQPQIGTTPDRDRPR